MTVQQYTGELKPFLSIILVTVTLFGTVFVKMENRHVGYEILKLSRVYRVKMDELRQKGLTLARLTRPDHVEMYAEHELDLKKAEKGQIIKMTNQRVVFRQ